jgi:hypothetical protein
MEYAQYVKHVREDLAFDVFHCHENVGVMVDGYLGGVTDVDSRLRGILNLKLGALGFG